MKTAQFATTGWFNTPEDRVEYVRRITAEFELRRPRGYAATACLIETLACTAIRAFNDIPLAVETDYSSTPRGVERAPKYVALGHAEINALAFAAKNGVSTDGATMTLAWFPCINCAAAIVQAGIRELIATEPNYENKPGQYDFANARRVLEDGGVKITLVK
jgi:dCMP deaminase